MFHYHETGGLWAVTKGKYKVHFTTVPFHRAKPEIHENPLLFDIHHDFMESNNIAGLYPEIVDDIKEEVEKHQKNIENS